MKKQVILRGLFGAPIGLFITTAIAIGISYSVGNGSFYPVAPALAEHCGSELNAVFFQTVMSLLYGAVFGGASAIWEMERWSLLRQTVTHLAVVSLTTLPVALLLGWMQPSLGGFLGYFGLFLAIYAVIWLSIWLPIRRRLRRINRSL